MGNVKWKAGVGVAMVADATTEAGAPSIYLPCKSAIIEEVPLIYERVPNFIPYVDHIEAAGFEYGFAVEGISPTAHMLGYLLWLFAAGDAWSDPEHTITPEDDSKYLNVFKGLGGADLGGGGVTQLLIGAKIGSLSIEFPEKEYAACSVQGFGCNLGTPISALTPSIPTGADNAPLSWAALQHASGYFKVGINGGLAAADDTIKGLKIEMNRSVIPSGIQLGSNQPTKVDSGTYRGTISFTKEFTGSDAEAQYAAFKAQQALEIQLRADMGANYLSMTIPKNRFNAKMLDGVGAGDEVIMAEVSVVMQKDDASDLFTAVTKDGSSALYT